jgi:hypothetical protein
MLCAYYSVVPVLVPLCFHRDSTTTTNESWVTEKVTKFKDALLCRFGKEKVIQSSLRKLVKLKQSKINKLQLNLIALRRDLQILSDKFIVKQCVQDIFSNVIMTSEFAATLGMAGNLRVLESNYEAKVDKFVYEYDMKMLEDKYTIESLST